MRFYRACFVVLSTLVYVSTSFAQSWLQNTTTASPTGRYEHGMVYDANRNVSVIFGGNDINTTRQNDTWEFNGTTWTQITTTNTPGVRHAMGLAYNSTSNLTVLFGGGGVINVLGDTWTYNGTDWTQLSPTTSPAARRLHTMAYDSNRNRIVLFGGQLGDSSLNNETWEFDGTDWSQVTTTNTPPVRFGGTMAFDSNRNAIVLFGGFSGANTLNDTWEYDGTNWTQISPTTSPPARSSASMAFDSSRNTVILFGGSSDTGNLSDTWEWDGTDWTNVTTASSPTEPISTAMVYDSNRSLPVIFGGVSSVASDSTWELNFTIMPTPTATATATATATIAPTATSTATPTATATPTNTPIPTEIPTQAPTATPTATLTPVPTATSTPNPTVTSTLTPIPTSTLIPTRIPVPTTEIPVVGTTLIPTGTIPPIQTTPTLDPSLLTPTVTPTSTPTSAPTATPTPSELDNLFEKVCLEETDDDSNAYEGTYILEKVNKKDNSFNYIKEDNSDIVLSGKLGKLIEVIDQKRSSNKTRYSRNIVSNTIFGYYTSYISDNAPYCSGYLDDGILSSGECLVAKAEVKIPKGKIVGSIVKTNSLTTDDGIPELTPGLTYVLLFSGISPNASPIINPINITVVDNQGNYEFSEVDPGEYHVIFKGADTKFSTEFISANVQGSGPTQLPTASMTQLKFNDSGCTIESNSIIMADLHISSDILRESVKQYSNISELMALNSTNGKRLAKRLKQLAKTEEKVESQYTQMLKIAETLPVSIRTKCPQANGCKSQNLKPIRNKFVKFSKRIAKFAQNISRGNRRKFASRRSDKRENNSQYREVRKTLKALVKKAKQLPKSTQVCQETTG